MLTERSNLLQSIAETIADYRFGEIPEPNADHVEMWINQFDTPMQLAILREIDHVLKRTYITKHSVEGFLSQLAVHKEITGGNPRDFWPSVGFLDVQEHGSSQRDLLRMLGMVLKSQCGISLSDCSGTSGTYLYLDDGIYTGNRILSDLTSWIQSDAPDESILYVIVIALHQGGKYYAETRLKQVAETVGKTIRFDWGRHLTIEDRRAYTNRSDVLRPTAIPNDQSVIDYSSSLGYVPTLRVAGSLGDNGFYSCEEGRHILEQELLRAGVQIRSLCPFLNEYQRPLGNSVLETLGFGSLLVTFRNCPNNAPLALWAGDPWYPLFRRKTN